MDRREPHVWEDVSAARATHGWELADVTHILASGAMTDCELIPWGSNYTFAVHLECDGVSTLGVYKPMRGEAPLWDFPRGTLYRREYAAYVLAQLLGWDFVPPTIIRDGQHGIGSVQLFVEHEPVDYFHFREECPDELKRMCLFDMVANNADRKAGHCLKGVDGRIWGIDHGLTFNVQPKLRTVLWDYAEQPVPRNLIDELLDFRTDSARLKELYRQLDDCLSREELAILLKRIDAVVEHPLFPAPYSRRSVPWPLY
ncbi:MAG TPA: SCO1664 family protein [Chloroflexota bacterium]|nr:SCO1664 family protein [Chloroflexota bacterium]